MDKYWLAENNILLFFLFLEKKYISLTLFFRIDPFGFSVVLLCSKNNFTLFFCFCFWRKISDTKINLECSHENNNFRENYSYINGASSSILQKINSTNQNWIGMMVKRMAIKSLQKIVINFSFFFQPNLIHLFMNNLT